MKPLETTRISSKGQITIPTRIRRNFGIKGGQTFTFQLRKDGILIKPVEVDITDLTTLPQWAKGLQAALDDVKAGRSRKFSSEQEFISHLDRLEKKRAR